MRPRLVAGIVGGAVIVGVLLIIAIFSLNTFNALNVPSSHSQQLNAIAHENAQHGTTSWQIPEGKGATIEIQAYAGATSVLPGQKLSFYVSTQLNSTSYGVEIYRLGWYGGAGGRLMGSRKNLVGYAQGYFDPNTHNLVKCGSCHVDTKTGLVEANWRLSYTLTLPSNWVTGVYLAKFIGANGMQTYAPFDVRGNPKSLYVAVTANTTYQAYNAWGGYSLYKSYDKHLVRGVKVSFDRPYDRAQGAGDLLLFEINAIHWLERQGYDLSYISNVDVHADAAQLQNHHAYLSLGHDEYWSKEMRDGVERARDVGVGLAFFGANAAYWQIRFEPDSARIPNRTIVCYKVQTYLKNLALDPLYGKDDSIVTTLWRDPLISRPENALVGIMFSGYTQDPQGFPWRPSPQAKSLLLNGTGLQSGQSYGCELVGYEWDRVFNNGSTPVSLKVLADSPTLNYRHIPDSSNTTYYIASSGAMVFATGSVYWATALDGYRYTTDKLCSNQNPVVPGMQTLLAHIMNALVVNHASST